YVCSSRFALVPVLRRPESRTRLASGVVGDEDHVVKVSGFVKRSNSHLAAGGGIVHGGKQRLVRVVHEDLNRARARVAGHTHAAPLPVGQGGRRVDSRDAFPRLAVDDKYSVVDSLLLAAVGREMS